MPTPVSRSRQGNSWAATVERSELADEAEPAHSEVACVPGETHCKLFQSYKIHHPAARSRIWTRLASLVLCFKTSCIGLCPVGSTKVRYPLLLPSPSGKRKTLSSVMWQKLAFTMENSLFCWPISGADTNVPLQSTYS